MTEFKNVNVWTGGPSDNLNWNVGGECYPSRDYDMKITFTKKDPDFFPGWFLYSDVPEGYQKEIKYFQAPPPNNGWERVTNRG